MRSASIRASARSAPTSPVRPDSRYGVSKAFGERWVRLFGQARHDRDLPAHRQCGAAPLDARRLSIWISPEDIVQLFHIGLEHPDIRFDILYGVSDNEASWWDNSRAPQLGYRPASKGEDHRAHAEAEQAKIGPDPVGDLFQGGTFTSAEFTNDVKRAGPSEKGCRKKQKKNRFSAAFFVPRALHRNNIRSCPYAKS